ncbi:hypothetical protein GGS26DRAFT_484481 [Hypomontagnella submonticulosa]|nr:hypothetical protein GGS26DRAFT_484481 [Hypomontagnella submonticulosa]
MASHFQIQKPYVLAALPRPLDPTTGRYVVSEVYGCAPGSRKRKRHELAVGIDGEAVNIYNVSSARLVTSYPVPPQSLFECPIASIRRKVEGTQDVLRYTYAATDDSHEHKITLFKDFMDTSSNTRSATTSTSLGLGQPVVCVAPITTQAAQTPDDALLVVRKDGEVLCLDAESLKRKWNSSSAVLRQDLPPTSKDNFSVDFCCSVLLSDFVQGVSKGNDDAGGLFPEIKQDMDVNAEVLVLISSYGPNEQRSRYLHVVAVPPPSRGSTNTQQGIVQLHAVPLPSPAQAESSPSSYRLDLRSGNLLELRGQLFNMYDLTASLPKITSTMELTGTTSFLRLSKTSLLCSTPSRLSIYNPVYRSLQNSVSIDLDGQTASNAGADPTTCLLTSYFSRLELAVAIVDTNLVAIQLEAPILRTRKRRAEGLLIDSIGRGLPLTKKPSTHVSNEKVETSVFTNYIPGSIRGDYWESWTADEAKADAFLNANDIRGLEMLLAQKFGIQVQDDAYVTNGMNGEDMASARPPLAWKFPKTRAAYTPVDRRWVLYAINRAFQWNDAFPEDQTIPRLICQLPQSDVVNYLVDAGHLTLSNLKSAFRKQMADNEKADSFLAEQIVLRLADVDPSLELLVAYVSATNLGAVELLIAVRTIMRSLELVQDPKKPPPKLLTNGSTEEVAENGDVEGEEDAEVQNIGMELDDLEDEIQKTVSYLNEDAGIRGNGLSASFAKLGNCPGVSMIKALRATFKPEEILSLIYLLRIELVRGAWTSRYLDTTDFEKDTSLDAPPDGIIKLLADLLGRCVDSIGPGGWLLNDAVLTGDETGDFIASLRLEVSAALEGLEEAIYLRGIVGEAVKFCETSKKAEVVEGVATVDKMRPIPLPVKEAGSAALPLGLKARDHVSAQKIVAGGEIVDRSLRETGHLRSQHVGSYSLERIAI